MSPNERQGEMATGTHPDVQQVGGFHYKDGGDQYQHWNLVTIHKWDYFQAQIIKYLMRWKRKGGVQDLMKARHFLEKYISVNECYADTPAGDAKEPNRRYVEQ